MVKIGIEIVNAQTAEQRELCYKVRYDVFIKETGYIQKENESGLESDGYDELDTSFHFLAYYDGVPAATVRLLLPNEGNARKDGTFFGLPIEELFDIKYYTTSNLRIGEVSRSSVKLRFRSTKTIFYLWKGLIDFAVQKGITDLVTNVNPETDKLFDAYQIYDYVKSTNLMDRNITVYPKKPGIGKIRSFRFPLIKNTCVNCESGVDGQADFQMPQTLKLFTRIGSLFTGEPMYCEKIDMCSMPMNLKLKDVYKTSFGKLFFGKEGVSREQAA